MKRFLDSAWLRGAQFYRNTVGEKKYNVTLSFDFCQLHGTLY